MSGPAIALTKNDKGAFRRALEAEMKGAEKDLRNDVTRQVVNGQITAESGTTSTPRTGKLARLDTSTTTTTLNLHSEVTDAEIRFLFVGMVVDVIDQDDGSDVAASRTITAIDKTNRTVTIDGANITTDDTHILVREDAYDNEFKGLQALINDNAGDQFRSSDAVTIHNLDSDSVDNWASPKVGGSSTPISEDILMEGFDARETEGAGDEPSSWLVVGSYEQRRALTNKLQNQKRYTSQEAQTPTAGWKGLDVAGRGVFLAERYNLDDDIFLIDPAELSWFVGQDFTFDQVDGKVLFKALDGSDAYEARMKAYVALAATNRNHHVRVEVQSV